MAGIVPRKGAKGKAVPFAAQEIGRKRIWKTREPEFPSSLSPQNLTKLKSSMTSLWAYPGDEGAGLRPSRKRVCT